MKNKKIERGDTIEVKRDGFAERAVVTHVWGDHVKWANRVSSGESTLRACRLISKGSYKKGDTVVILDWDNVNLFHQVGKIVDVDKKNPEKKYYVETFLRSPYIALVGDVMKCKDEYFEPYATLTLTRQQYDDIRFAMEFYHRFICGDEWQLKNIPHWGKAFRKAPELMQQIAMRIFDGEQFDWSGSSLAHSDDIEERELGRLQYATYAIYREMSHAIAIHEGRNNVLSQETLRSTLADLPIIHIFGEPKQSEIPTSSTEEGGF